MLSSPSDDEVGGCRRDPRGASLASETINAFARAGTLSNIRKPLDFYALTGM
jgi:hypothetical protein